MTPQRRTRLILTSLALIFAFPIANSVLYTVDEREMAVILQFGEPVESRTEPGLYFKLPLIQEVRRLPKTLQVWHGSRAQEQLVDVPTKDGKKIEVTVWAAWRINDPVLFVQTLRNEANAEARVKEFVRSHARDTITSNNLIEVIRSTSRKMTFSLGLPETAAAKPNEQPGEKAAADALIAQMIPPEAKEPVEHGRMKIIDEIKLESQQALKDDGQGSRQGRGIELVDVGLARIEFVPQVRTAAFNRAIALMDSIAVKYTSEGEQRKQEIINLTQAEVQKIQGEGSKEASTTRGKVDAEIIESYATAINETGDFFNFLRTLEVYKSAIKQGTRLILTTDGDLFQMLKRMPAAKSKAPNP
jgi:membrane protease subunit HflC